MLDDRRQVSQRYVSSDRKAAGLFKRAGKLQNPAFAEVAAEYLHPDG